MEHLDCGGELNFAIDETGTYILVCQKCGLAWEGCLHLLNPPGMMSPTDRHVMAKRVKEKHPDWKR